MQDSNRQVDGGLSFRLAEGHSLTHGASTHAHAPKPAVQQTITPRQ